MTATETLPRPAAESGAQRSSAATQRIVSTMAAAKIRESHRDRLAVVYVRQSTPQQVTEHQESLQRQYGLTDYALGLGWSSERILVIDQDLGISGRTVEARQGFQRLLTEVTLDHVGIVLGLEMSRLARSSKDWQAFFELCTVFGTLIADEDGVYDGNDPNDRLLLGLKGIMSEVELQIMRNRLGRAKLNKAERGALFLNVPAGYIKTSDGGVAFDPDEQARSVIRLIFDKFDELGSGHAVHRFLLKHRIQIGVRPIEGANRGQLEWHNVTSSMLFGILRHPMYAGAYVYGRCLNDPKRMHTHKCARKWVPPEEWKVLLHDRVPAYITWDQYQCNRRRLKENRARTESKGNPRTGTALLGGLAFCGACGHRLNAYYSGRTGHPRYECMAYMRNEFEKTCRGISASTIDALVTQQVLSVLEPAQLELSIQAAENVVRERERLERHQCQQLERAKYEARRAERHYRAVDPENRLVARTLEQEWEAALCLERQTQENLDRFRLETPTQLTSAEQELIRSLAGDIPALWCSLQTTPADHKEIIRCLVERVVINVRGDTEQVDVTIHWAGGYVSQHSIIRPVGRYQQLEDYDRIIARIREGRTQGLTAAKIAERLNQDGFRSPATRAGGFTKNIVNSLESRLGIRKPLLSRDKLATDEWWLTDLAMELKINARRMYHWVTKGYVHARKLSDAKFWILWADHGEMERLGRLRDYLTTEHHVPYPAELTRPKDRSAAKC